MRRLVTLFHLPLVFGLPPQLALAQKPASQPPIIDVHLHALNAEARRTFGPNPITRTAPPASATRYCSRAC